MKSLLGALLIMVIYRSAGGTEFDHVILERFHCPGSSEHGICLEASRLCRQGYTMAFLHTNPYRVNSLSWDFAVARYGWRGLGIYSTFRSYRLDDLYDDMTISAGMAAHIYKGAYALFSAERQREHFEGVDDFTRISCDFRVSYDAVKMVVEAGLEDMIAKLPYNVSPGERAEPVMRATYFASEAIGLSAGFRRDFAGRDRWTFGQSVLIADPIELHLGYMSNPNALQWGLDLSYERITFIFDYTSANKLDDTIIFGLSIGH